MRPLPCPACTQKQCVYSIRITSRVIGSMTTLSTRRADLTVSEMVMARGTRQLCETIARKWQELAQLAGHQPQTSSGRWSRRHPGKENPCIPPSVTP